MAYLRRIAFGLGYLSLLNLNPLVGAQVPPALLKPVLDKVVAQILKPKMKVESFTLGGFTVKDVDPTGDATPEHFEGTGMIQLPPPAVPVKITFANLVLKGSAAEGTVEAGFHAGYHVDHQGWNYQLKKAVISDKAAHLVGTATVAGIRLSIGDLAFTHAGISGTLSPGDLPLSEGPFSATLQKAEVVFGTQPPVMKGSLKVEIELPVRHALSGEVIQLETGPITMDSTLLTGTGVAVDSLAVDLPLLHKGITWRMEKVAFRFEKGQPFLGGPTRLQFPLQAFCRVGATDQPYLTGANGCRIEGSIPSPEDFGAGNARRVGDKAQVGVQGKIRANTFEGFTGLFPLTAATLHPSGLTAFKLIVEGGHVFMSKGVSNLKDNAISGRLQFGSSFTSEVTFSKAKASLLDGLYLESGLLKEAVPLGTYQVKNPTPDTICDFSPSLSPEGVVGGWKGLYLPSYAFVLPGQLHTLDEKNKEVGTWVEGQKGWFEANGRFTGTVSAPPIQAILYFVNVALNPFELEFVDGVLLKGPIVTGQVEMKAPPIIKEFSGDLSFHLTQNGLEQIEVKPNKIYDTALIGVKMAIDSAVLNPTSWDFSGRFDFAVDGAALPSLPFEHMVLEASTEGSGNLWTLGMGGARWDAFPDNPNVNLWGFGFNLTERGFGITAKTAEDEGRFFVGFGGQMEVNPMLPSLYNRVLFTTLKGDPTKGTVEFEKSFELDQDMAGLGSLKASLDFQVKTKLDSSSNYFVSNASVIGKGDLSLNMGEAPITVQAGAMFGRGMQGGNSFPYCYVLGHLASNSLAVPIAPDVEIFGFLGGLSQNFKPAVIRSILDEKNDTKLDIEGEFNPSLGYGIIAGVDLGTTDQNTFHGELDLYVTQNLTTKLHGEGWLFTDRKNKPADNHVFADINFSRNPNVLDATFGADLSQAGGMLRFIGEVQLHFSADKKFIHIGTKETPIRALLPPIGEGTGYLTAELNNKVATLGAGVGYSLDTGRKSFGPLYGRAWLTANGDLVIEVSASGPRLSGMISATGGAEFGMEFETFWDTYDITIFSGSLSTALAFQVPGSPKLSGVVTIHYSVLGGLFDGDASAHLEF